MRFTHFCCNFSETRSHDLHIAYSPDNVQATLLMLLFCDAFVIRLLHHANASARITCSDGVTLFGQGDNGLCHSIVSQNKRVRWVACDAFCVFACVCACVCL